MRQHEPTDPAKSMRCPDCKRCYEPTQYAGEECPVCMARLPSLPICERCDTDIDPRNNHDECPECGWQI